MSTFSPFSRLPTELRRFIFNLTTPTTTTIYINEADYDVTAVSPPPPTLNTSKEARSVALEWGMKKYPIWTVVDWEDIYLCPATTTLELIITPSKSASLNITWTELHAILGEALTEAKALHIVCAQPARLARLFMLPEGNFVGLGESCVEKGLFGSEVISSDRAVRESLRGDVLVTTSACTVEEISNGGVEVWRLAGEEISSGFGPEAKTVSTKAFEKVEVQGSSIQELHSAATAFGHTGPEAGEEGEEEEVEVEKSGDDLTKEALERLTGEMARLHPETAYKGGEEDPGGSVMPGSSLR